MYVGADDKGIPIPPGAPFADAGIGEPGQNPRINRVIGTTLPESFRVAINPPARFQIAPLFPNLALEAVQCVPGLLTRPCPQAISVQDPGVLVVNYRHEPIALRVFDPAKLGPDGQPGAQADGVAGDLGYALASQLKDKLGNVTPITRAIPDLNKTEQQLALWGKTLNAPTATILVFHRLSLVVGCCHRAPRASRANLRKACQSLGTGLAQHTDFVYG